MTTKETLMPISFDKLSTRQTKIVGPLEAYVRVMSPEERLVGESAVQRGKEGLYPRVTTTTSRPQLPVFNKHICKKEESRSQEVP
jgi:hypothetical protein